MDVKAAFHAAVAKSPNLSMQEFSTWPLLHEFRVTRPNSGAEVPVKPDGFIRVHEKETDTASFAYDCFIEVDRSSEVQEILVAKAACYQEFYRSGGFAVRNGASASEFREFPFRVLIVFKSAARRNNTAERLAQHLPPILTQAWLTTFAEITADPLGAIWILPMDYRNLVAGTPFHHDRSKPRFEYRPQPMRDNFIEVNIKKRRFQEGYATTEDSDSAQQKQ